MELQNKEIQKTIDSYFKSYMIICDDNNDQIYESLNLFRNMLMKDGKKYAADKIVRDLEFKLIDKFNLQLSNILIAAIFNSQPLFELKSRRQGGTMIQVPFPLTLKRQRFLALKHIIHFAKKRKEYRMVDKLENELLNSIKGTSPSVRKKEEIHKLAETNRAFSFIRF
jgi:small subunit ribosomal protein S7